MKAPKLLSMLAIMTLLASCNHDDPHAVVLDFAEIKSVTNVTANSATLNSQLLGQLSEGSDGTIFIDDKILVEVGFVYSSDSTIHVRLWNTVVSDPTLHSDVSKNVSGLSSNEKYYVKAFVGCKRSKNDQTHGLVFSKGSISFYTLP